MDRVLQPGAGALEHRAICCSFQLLFGCNQFATIVRPHIHVSRCYIGSAGGHGECLPCLSTCFGQGNSGTCVLSQFRYAQLWLGLHVATRTRRLHGLRIESTCGAEHACQCFRYSAECGEASKLGPATVQLTFPYQNLLRTLPPDVDMVRCCAAITFLKTNRFDEARAQYANFLEVYEQLDEESKNSDPELNEQAALLMSTLQECP